MSFPLFSFLMVFDQLCEFIFSFVWLREWIFEIEKDSFDVVLATD